MYENLLNVISIKMPADNSIIEVLLQKILGNINSFIDSTAIQQKACFIRC